MTSFIRKALYAISANLLSLVVSVLTTLIVPRFLGNNIEQYGYLQIYLFYITYLGLLHFGWCDGIFLRDGGKEYCELNKTLYSCQFWLFSGFELILSLIIATVGYFTATNNDYFFIFVAVALNVFIFLPRTMLQYFLQTTNRIKEYASITMLGRALYGISIVVIIICFSKSYKWFVIGDIFGKFIALILSIYWCRDIVFSKPCKFNKGIREALTNISIGIKLTFANIASMLITGIVRWGIQTNWDVATYGKISLTLNVSSLIMTFISAVALVMYPTLRRKSNNELMLLYGLIRTGLMTALLAILVVYYPMQLILSSWLPQYAESLRYMAILFPMCIYSAKMTMLVQTYMNVFRLEKQILKVNLAGVVFAIVTTFISIFLFNSLFMAILSIVINQMFRCIIAEYVLSKRMSMYIVSDMFLEMLLSAIFMAATWFVGGWKGIGIYFGAYIIYIIIKRKEILGIFQKIIKRGA